MIKEACSNCKCYRPKYKGVGECLRDSGQNSPFWISIRDAYLMVTADFYCKEFAPQSEDISGDTL